MYVDARRTSISNEFKTIETEGTDICVDARRASRSN
jgi:hypothetical protein